jgi:hypothetical protein
LTREGIREIDREFGKQANRRLIGEGVQVDQEFGQGEDRLDAYGKWGIRQQAERRSMGEDRPQVHREFDKQANG